MSPRLLAVAAVALLALLPVALASFGVVDSSNIDSAFADLDALQKWDSFKQQHKKLYSSKEAEINRSVAQRNEHSAALAEFTASDEQPC